MADVPIRREPLASEACHIEHNENEGTQGSMTTSISEYRINTVKAGTECHDEVAGVHLLPRYLNRELRPRGSIRRFFGGSVVNKHQSLFLLESRGPAAALYAIRFGLLSEVVLSAVALEQFRGRILCTGDGYTEGDGSPDCSNTPTSAGLVVLIFTVLVSLTTVLFLGSALRRLVTATSIECMKRWDDIADVIAAASRMREHATFCSLVGIAAASNRARAAIQASHLEPDGQGAASSRSSRSESSNRNSRITSLHFPKFRTVSRSSENDPLKIHLRFVFNEIANKENDTAVINRSGLSTVLQVFPLMS